MIASCQQLRRFDIPYKRLPQLLRARSDAMWGWLCVALGFVSFMPYPAFPVGSNAAIQTGNVLCVLMFIPILLMPAARKHLALYLVMLAPLAISSLKAAIAADGDASIGFKEVAAWSVSCLAMVVFQVNAPRYALSIITGIALATLVHSAAGYWQFIRFADGEFPFFRIYINQSFLSVQANAGIMAQWERRPFGLFPEPSAMSSSLAPWLVLWTAMGCGVVKLKQAPAVWQSALFNLAAAAGILLVILSQSGHAVITLLAIIPLVGLWFARARATPKTYAILLGMFAVVAPAMLYVAADSLSHRMVGGAVGNSSWEERSDSLIIGLSEFANGGVFNGIFGIGVGQMTPRLWQVAHIGAVFSVLLNYIYETGLIGVVAVTWVAHALWTSWRSARRDLTFLAFAAVWMVGITLTTSYSQLLPIWMALGMLIVWPQVCEPLGMPVAATRRRRVVFRPISPVPAAVAV